MEFLHLPLARQPRAGTGSSMNTRDRSKGMTNQLNAWRRAESVAPGPLRRPNAQVGCTEPATCAGLEYCGGHDLIKIETDRTESAERIARERSRKCWIRIVGLVRQVSDVDRGLQVLYAIRSHGIVDNV